MLHICMFNTCVTAFINWLREEQRLHVHPDLLTLNKLRDFYLVLHSDCGHFYFDWIFFIFFLYR